MTLFCHQTLILMLQLYLRVTFFLIQTCSVTSLKEVALEPRPECFGFDLALMSDDICSLCSSRVF